MWRALCDIYDGTKGWLIDYATTFATRVPKNSATSCWAKRTTGSVVTILVASIGL